MADLTTFIIYEIETTKAVNFETYKNEELAKKDMRRINRIKHTSDWYKNVGKMAVAQRGYFEKNILIRSK